MQSLAGILKLTRATWGI